MPEIAFTDVAPVVPVRNLDAALERYRRLGFAAHAYDGPQRYGFVERGRSRSTSASGPSTTRCAPQPSSTSP